VEVGEVFGLGTQELVVILLIVLVLFGGKKIPELMRSLGQGLREFRESSTQAMDDIKKASEVDDHADETKHTA
jgi:sec-independent protein translocase protein TatA